MLNFENRYNEECLLERRDSEDAYQGARFRRIESAETKRNFETLVLAKEARMKWMQAVLSIAFVISGPPLPPAPISC